ncbi:MAG: class II aldolase/adducin family protein [Roseovarius sp.]
MRDIWTADRPVLNREELSPEEWAVRADLAAAFRIAYEFGWTESVGNHFSAALPGGGTQFLMNPFWMLFSEIRASDLMCLVWTEHDRMEKPDPPDRSGWCIHSRIHALNPAARVVLHIHTPYATALAGLKDPRLKPIDQVTARFVDRVAYDLDFEDVAISTDEGERLAAKIGDKPILMMGNHGVTACGSTVAEAFEELYLFERACRTLVLAYGTGQPLNILSDNVAHRVSAGWEGCRDMAGFHFAQLRMRLDRSAPDYTL